MRELEAKKAEMAEMAVLTKTDIFGISVRKRGPNLGCVDGNGGGGGNGGENTENGVKHENS